MSDWPDIKKPDDWEQNHWGEDGPGSDESENTRLTILMGVGWSGKDIDVIKWMTNVEPPQWAVWEKSQIEPGEPEDE